jgi:hypothetical protein
MALWASGHLGAWMDATWNTPRGRAGERLPVEELQLLLLVIFWLSLGPLGTPDVPA